jgi:AcrR family transcriptional regulator
MNMMDKPPGTLRERMKEQTRELIVDALLEALASGEFEGMAHDALAKRVGVSRQTIYRYFPDRESLMQALWARVTTGIGQGVGMPLNEEALLASMHALFTGFDKVAPLMTVAMSTPQGRAMRNSVKERRQEAYSHVTAEATAALDARNARMATAVIQLLNSGYAWLEMRQQWDLTGEEIASACRWAARTLLADLRTRGAKPLDDDV